LSFDSGGFHIYNAPVNILKNYKRMRALIVDDNDQILDVLSFMLESNNVDYRTVNNGEEALNLISNSTKTLDSSFDLIFLDLAMPNMSGFQVVEDLYMNNSLKDSKLIVITALELSPEDENNLLKKGVTAILKKPFLIEDVEKLLLS
jgi:CheY-like chemotaxis protein